MIIKFDMRLKRRDSQRIANKTRLKYSKINTWHMTFNHGVRSSTLRWVTRKTAILQGLAVFLLY